MTTNQLTQMAISAILRCKEQINLFDLNDLLCGKQTRSLEMNGFDKIKTFGAGKKYTNHQWHYWFIQMIQQDLFFVDYDDNDNLKVLDKGHQVIKGEIEVTLKTNSSESLRITRNGVPIIIDFDFQDSINWRKETNEFNKMVYWNYSEERRIDVNTLIPPNVVERERVKAKFLEIASMVYKLALEGETIIIPKKVDFDMFGKEVLSLNLPFEECLSRLEHFIKTTGRYPQMNAVNDEAALRKWYREIGHGLIEITPEQEMLFKQFMEKYPMSKLIKK